MLSCQHVGCSYTTDVASKRASHERSLNSHTAHFSECKGTCSLCQQMVQSGEWFDYSCSDNSISYDFSPLPVTPVASVRAPTLSVELPTGVAVAAASMKLKVNFLRCSHDGCDWTSAANSKGRQRSCVSRHEHSVQKHRFHIQQGARTCRCCQLLVETGIWSVDAAGNILLEETAQQGQSSRKRSRSPSPDSTDVPSAKRIKRENGEADTDRTYSDTDSTTSDDRVGELKGDLPNTFAALQSLLQGLSSLPVSERKRKLSSWRKALEVLLSRLSSQLPSDAAESQVWEDCYSLASGLLAQASSPKAVGDAFLEFKREVKTEVKSEPMVL